MSELSRIDERLSQVVELLRCLVSEVRETRRAIEEEERHTHSTNSGQAVAPYREERIVASGTSGDMHELPR